MALVHGADVLNIAPIQYLVVRSECEVALLDLEIVITPITMNPIPIARMR
jgi:hypothetical protein